MRDPRSTDLRFDDVTETTGIPVTAEGASMMYTRYAAGAAVADGRRALEIACGGGNGLGLVRASARSLVAGDYSPVLLAEAHRHFNGRVPLARLSAEALPFRSGSFDAVLFFEASYYVPTMEHAFDEAARVLAPGGTLLFVNANPERPDFIKSPHSVHYHSADQFREALEARGLRVTTEGAFPVTYPQHGLRSRALRTARILIRSLGLVPRTLKGRARIKRLIHRNLIDLPPELPKDFAAIEPRVPVPPGPVRGFKVIYVTATRATPR